MKNLIICSSKYGSTEECAQLLKEELIGQTNIVNLMNSKKLELSNYENVILGAPIYIGNIPKEMKKFVNENIDQLLSKNTGIFILSGDNNESYLEKNYPTELLDQAIIIKHFGAVLDIAKLSFIKRLVIKYIIRKESHRSIREENIKSFADKINVIFRL